MTESQPFENLVQTEPSRQLRPYTRQPPPSPTEIDDSFTDIEEDDYVTALGTFMLIDSRPCSLERQDLVEVNLGQRGRVRCFKLKATIKEEERQRSRRVPLFGGAFECLEEHDWSRIAFEQYSTAIGEMRYEAELISIPAKMVRFHFDRIPSERLCVFATICEADLFRTRLLLRALCANALSSLGVLQEVTAPLDQDRVWIEALQTVLCAGPDQAYNNWWQGFVDVAVSVTCDLLATSIS